MTWQMCHVVQMVMTRRHRHVCSGKYPPPSSILSHTRIQVPRRQQGNVASIRTVQRGDNTTHHDDTTHQPPQPRTTYTARGRALPPTNDDLAPINDNPAPRTPTVTTNDTADDDNPPRANDERPGHDAPPTHEDHRPPTRTTTHPHKRLLTNENDCPRTK